MTLRMNRWKAAWVALTLLWLAFLVSIGRPMFPTKALQEERARGSVRAGWSDSHVDCFSRRPGDCPPYIREAPLSREELSLKEQHAVEEALKDTAAAQASFLGEGIAWWLIPVGVMYLIGLSCAWVRKRMRTT